MNIVEIVTKNKSNLEAYYYARKCLDVLKDKIKSSNPVDKKDCEENEIDFESFLQKLLNVKREYEQKNIDSLNIFWMLNVVFSEKVHSAFIGELLNPRGMHGKGKLFLKLFCEKMDIDVPLNTYKLLEYPFDLDGTTRGRLDVYLPCDESPSHEIIIENKIYASDGEKQIEKYKTFKPDAKLFYLTLNGKKASEKSVGESSASYTSISYKEDILEWLKQCKENCNSAKDVAVLKMIEQYESIVKMLTGNAKTLQTEEAKDVKNIFEAKWVDLSCLEKDCDEIEKEFEKEFFESFENVAKSLNAEIIEKSEYLRDGKYGGVSFKFGEWNDYLIRLEFQDEKYQKLFYGVRSKDKNGCPEKLRENFKSYFCQKNEAGRSSSFLVGASWFRYQNWDLDCYVRVLDGSFEKDLTKFLENIKYYMKIYLPPDNKDSS